MNPAPLPAREVSIGSNGLQLLWKELAFRTKKPATQVVFLTYLGLGVLLFGGLSVWLELVLYMYHPESHAALLTALVTFFPALIGSSSLGVLFDDTVPRPVRAFLLFFLFIFLLPAVWLTLDKNVPPTVAFLAALLCCIVSIWTWWIANALNAAFQDAPQYDATLGGSLSKDLPGSLDQFKV